MIRFPGLILCISEALWLQGLPHSLRRQRLIKLVREFPAHRVPRGPKDQNNSRFRSRLKISIENEIFERATHRGPIFCGEIEASRLKFSIEIKISIEIENFDRDHFYLIVGPSG